MACVSSDVNCVEMYRVMLTGACLWVWLPAHALELGTVDFSNGQDCMRKFISNQYFGALVFGACVLGNATASSGTLV